MQNTRLELVKMLSSSLFKDYIARVMNDCSCGENKRDYFFVGSHLKYSC